MLSDFKKIGFLDTLLILWISSILLLFLLWLASQTVPDSAAFDTIPQWIIDVSSNFWSYITVGSGGILTWYIRKHSYGSVEHPPYFAWILVVTALMATSVWLLSDLFKATQLANEYEYELVFINEETKAAVQFTEPNLKVKIFCQTPPLIVSVTEGTAKFKFRKDLMETMTLVQLEGQTNYEIKEPRQLLKSGILNDIIVKTSEADVKSLPGEPEKEPSSATSRLKDPKIKDNQPLKDTNIRATITQPESKIPKKIIFESDTCANVEKIIKAASKGFDILLISNDQLLMDSKIFEVSYGYAFGPSISLNRILKDDKAALIEFRHWVKKFEDCLDIESTGENTENSGRIITQIKAYNENITFFRNGAEIEIKFTGRSK